MNKNMYRIPFHFFLDLNELVNLGGNHLLEKLAFLILS